MAQKLKPPRLYLRTRKDGPASWVIRHRSRMISTGFGEADMEKAKEALADYGAKTGHLPDSVVSYQALRKRGYVYFATCEVPDFPIKIGWATDIKSRIPALQCSLPFKVKILASAPGTLEDEHTLHISFAIDRLEGEWFLRSPDLMALIQRFASPRGLLPAHIRTPEGAQT